MAACFSLAPTCVLDWDGISAVATFVATFVALGSAYAAIKLPQQQRAIERSESTLEVLGVVREATELLVEAVAADSPFNKTALATVAARSKHLRAALQILVNRPSLTDGAIIAGSGAIEMLAAIEQQHQTNMAGKNGPNHHIDAVEILPKVVGRTRRVVNYAIERGWPKSLRFIEYSKLFDEGGLFYEVNATLPE